ncbi:hypothetical protein DFJ77DRAFT_439732 [Powellomyces hirtus]|nr:hypothetical protein DFJ77DRAFT_439732 [Powellomyces hirtus]
MDAMLIFTFVPEIVRDVEHPIVAHLNSLESRRTGGTLSEFTERVRQGHVKVDLLRTPPLHCVYPLRLSIQNRGFQLRWQDVWTPVGDIGLYKPWSPCLLNAVVNGTIVLSEPSSAFDARIILSRLPAADVPLFLMYFRNLQRTQYPLPLIIFQSLSNWHLDSALTPQEMSIVSQRRQTSRQWRPLAVVSEPSDDGELGAPYLLQCFSRMMEATLAVSASSLPRGTIPVALNIAKGIMTSS